MINKLLGEPYWPELEKIILESEKEFAPYQVGNASTGNVEVDLGFALQYFENLVEVRCGLNPYHIFIHYPTINESVTRAVYQTLIENLHETRKTLLRVKSIPLDKREELLLEQNLHKVFRAITKKELSTLESSRK